MEKFRPFEEDLSLNGWMEYEILFGAQGGEFCQAGRFVFEMHLDHLTDDAVQKAKGSEGESDCRGLIDCQLMRQ